MSLVNELIKGLLPEEEKKKVVAVYGGGFKPPTSGHFEVVKQALKENPEIDEFIILIGGKERDGISPDESILIWDIYKTYLPFKVEVKYTSVPPIKGIYNYAKEHLDEEVLFIIGAREGNDEDFKDIASRTTSLDKYPNLNLRTIVTQGGVSGTAARNASKISIDKFKPFVPSELSDEEVEQVYNIVADKIQEVLTENASYSQHIDVMEKIAQLTNHMIDKGMNIEPLPTMEFIDGDSENAKDFFGKTAYYDPNRQHIVLYTEGRHPKDIVRSYAHEMIHHIQYLEDRLGDVAGTNTMEDDHLDKIEQEANLRGTMTFRNWTDSILNEAVTTPKTEKKKINISFELFDGTKVDEDVILAFSPDSTGVFTLGDNVEKYTGLSKKEAEAYNETPTDAYIYGLVNTMNDGQDIFFWNNGTRLKGNALKLGDSVAVIEQLAHEGLHLTRALIAKTLMGDKFPTGEWPSVGEQDNDSIEEEQLTTALSYVLNQITKPFIEMASKYLPKLSLNEAIVGEKIECDNCGWSWNIKDGGNDLFICHKCGHDNTPLNEDEDSCWDDYKIGNPKTKISSKTGKRVNNCVPKNENKDPFGINAYARELGRLNEKVMDYKIYVDMDGVVADFDQRFIDLSGMLPREFETKYGKNAFWDFIDEGDNKLKFWVGIPQMSDAQQLIDFVSKYDYEMLTAPSLKKQSLMGKGLWMINQTKKGLFPSKPKVNYKSAKNKKDFAAPNHILIDDKASTIDSWNASGGIGILHTSASNTIKQLQKLGL